MNINQRNNSLRGIRRVSPSIQQSTCRKDVGPIALQNSNSHKTTLITEYHGYAAGVAARLISELNIPQNEREELIGAAYLGLVEAAERYNPHLGTRFKVYAFLRIRGAIIDYLRDNTSLSRELNRKVKAYAAASALREATSLYDEGISNIEKKRRVLELIGDYALIMRLSMEVDEVQNHIDQTPIAEELLNRKMQGSVLGRLIDRLPAKERMVIISYYFKDLNFNEIVGSAPGLTKSWISRLHRRALERLRKGVLGTSDGLGMLVDENKKRQSIRNGRDQALLPKMPKVCALKVEGPSKSSSVKRGDKVRLASLRTRGGRKRPIPSTIS